MTFYTSGAVPTTFRPRVTRLMTLMLAATLAGATGCGGDSGTGPAAGPGGHYELRNIDDETVPVEIHNGPYFDPVSGTFYNQFSCTVDGGEIELDEDDGRFTLTFGLTITADGQYASFAYTLVGDYEVQGDQILLQPDDAGSAWASLEGGRIVLPADILGDGIMNEYVFRR
jgi:hypothetical protein